jgi:ribosomal protein S24E
MKKELIRKFKTDDKKIVVLNIKDIYGPGKSKDVDDLDKLLENKNFVKYI